MKQEQLEIKPTELQILKSTRDLLSDPDKWTKRNFAVDADGYMCGVMQGCKFCILGAVRRSANNDSEATVNIMNQLRRIAGCENIANWNDDPERKYEDVLNIIDTRIKELENV